MGAEPVAGGYTGRTKFVGGQDLIEKFAQERAFASEMDFARFLHEIEPRRSVSGWRAAISRWKMEDKENIFQIPPDEYSETTPSRIRVYYDKSNDVYLTMLDNANEMIAVSGETHREMRRAYSKDGSNLSMREMSREFGFPEAWVYEYVKINRWNHQMDIHTDEEVQSRTEQDLIQEIVDTKRNIVLEKANREYWREISKDADKMRLLDAHLLNDFRDALKTQNLATKSVGKLKMAKAEPFAVVISPTDLHFGEKCWIDETGNEYDTEEARLRLLDRTKNLISRLPGRPEKIFLATGSDWFHVDNPQGSTTKGTLQDMSTTPTQIFMDGCLLAREHIELLRKVSSVEVVFMRGNHDRHMALALMMYLSAVYENTDDVKVICNPMIRQYLTWGNNLLGFTHGDGVKGNDLPLLMATEERKAWGDCEHHTWFHGHLHHMKLTEKGGTTVVQLPSLAGNDRWTFSKGYTDSRPGICAHLLDKDLGLIGNLFAPVIPNE